MIMIWIVILLCWGTNFSLAEVRVRFSSYAGPAAYNSLPHSIKLTTNTNRLQQLLKSHSCHVAIWHSVSDPGHFVSRALQVRICICNCVTLVTIPTTAKSKSKSQVWGIKSRFSITKTRFSIFTVTNMSPAVKGYAHCWVHTEEPKWVSGRDCWY